MNTGTFLVIEGQDYTGKTTQLNNIENYLKERNLPYVRVRSPGGDKFSEDLRELIMKSDTLPITDMLLFLAARIELSRTIIEPALKEGKIVISDRYDLSTLAYQGYGNDLVKEYLELDKSLEKFYVKPDNRLVLLINDDTYKKRRALRGVDNRLDNLGDVIEERIRQCYNDYAYKDKINIPIGAESSEHVVWRHIENWLALEFIPTWARRQSDNGLYKDSLLSYYTKDPPFKFFFKPTNQIV